jgi:hypothetical protein
MDCHRPLAVFLAALAVLALAVPIGVGPALAADDGEDAVTVPTSIPINTDASVQEYEQDGVVSGDISAPQMSVTIGTERDHVGLGYTLDPLEGSTRNDFVRIKHSEDISRTVKIPVRADYWKPFPRENLESISGGHVANLEPVEMDGKEYTLITVTFDGSESAVFPIPEDAVAAYSAAERTENRTNSTFGIDLGLTPSPWSYVDQTVFSENNTVVRIEGDPDEMMLQYNAGTGEEPEWLAVPDGQKRNVPVYSMEKEGVDGAVYVVSTTEEPPEIRYKLQSSWGDRASVWVREARALPERILDGLNVDVPFLTFAAPTVSTFSEVSA